MDKATEESSPMIPWVFIFLTKPKSQIKHNQHQIVRWLGGLEEGRDSLEIFQNSNLADKAKIRKIRIWMKMIYSIFIDKYTCQKIKSNSHEQC